MSIVGEANFPSKPLKDPGLDFTKFESLEQLRKEGFTAYALGPLMTYAEISEDIPSRFAAEPIKGRSDDVVGTFLTFDHPVVVYCEQWNYRLEVMENKCYEYFKMWMLHQLFLNTPKKTLYAPRLYPSPLLDPLSFVRNIGRPVSVDVYTSSSNHKLVAPTGYLDSKEKAKCYVNLEIRAPEHAVKEQADAIFGGQP